MNVIAPISADLLAPPPRLRTALVADLFCGAGGSSTGARRALTRLGWRMDLVAVNHWPVAIDTHSRNHPEARHYCMDLEAAKPRDLVPEGRLDLLMASPTCTHHSRARGGRPTSDQQRMDPWHVVRWCTELRVKRLLIENVPEFVQWGPVDERSGKPVKSRRGQYFEAWVNAIEATGFRLDWQILNAADFGDATTRQRFFLLARSDGRRVSWPAPSHAPAGVADLFGQRRPWRAAHSIIDWSLRGASIYDRPVPLVAKTLRRIEAGLIKFRWPARYLQRLQRYLRSLGLDPSPVPTMPTEIAEPFVLSRQSGGAPRALDQPTPGMTTVHSHVLIAPYYGGGSGLTCTSADRPLPAATTRARFGLVMPVTHGGGANRVRSTDDMMPTITTAARGELAFITAAFGERHGQAPRVHDLAAPLPTICAQGRVPLAVAGEDDDLLFRMFATHELAAAMGFNDDEAAYEFTGSKTQQVKQIGNAVPVNTAAALVGAIMGAAP